MFRSSPNRDLRKHHHQVAFTCDLAAKSKIAAPPSLIACLRISFKRVLIAKKSQSLPG